MIKVLQAHLDALIEPVLNPPEQMVIVDNTPPPNEQSIQRVSQAPAIMKTRDPMAKRNLILTKRIHQRQIHNYTPGYVPAITRDKRPNIIPDYVSRNHNVKKITHCVAHRD
jgi:hypothetical protein